MAAAAAAPATYAPVPVAPPAAAAAEGPRPEAQLVEHASAGVASGCCRSRPNNPPMESVFSLPPRRTIEVRRVYIIVNTFGGKGRGKIVLKAARAEFEKRGVAVEVLETKHKRHAEEYARSVALAGFDVLCAIGGDGTFNEVVNGLLTRGDGQRIPLGFIAGGTGNSLMVDFKCVDAHKCAEAICSGVVRAMDVVEATFHDPDRSSSESSSSDSPASRYFINALGFGLPVAAATTAESLRSLGQIRYDVGALINIAKGFDNPVNIQLDGTSIDCNVAFLGVLCGESMTFRFAPGAKVDDGLLDIAILFHTSRTRVVSVFDLVKQSYTAPRTGPGGAAGGGGGSHVFCEEVSLYRCKHFALEPRSTGAYAVDGELLGVGNVQCNVLPQLIEVVFK